jgi:hypothetical protein
VKGLSRGLLAGFIVAALASGVRAEEIVVLKGGTVVKVKQPIVRRGNTAYLTRTDGTLLSVPVSEIDRDASAAANRAAAVPPPPAPAPAASTPAEVAKANKENPKARVRITDADVSHPLDLEAGTGEEKKETAAVGGPRVEVADYSQEKNGNVLGVRGALRNPGQGSAENVRMTITAVDEKGQSIDATTASLSKGVVESGQSVEFTASLNVGDKTVASLRFAPQWTMPKPPPTTPGPGAAANANAAAGKPPAPKPTPYGRGTLYAPPVQSAPSEPPADGKTGYIPGASHPDNQPKPPSR